jgi:hypothetical protein
MKNHFLVLTTIFLLTLGACKKESPDTSSAVTIPTDTISTVKKDAMVDPDTTDTIPAEHYGINSSNLETAALVRLALQEIYKDDIAKKFIDETSNKFVFFEYDLNDDGKKEILVGLRGSYFCGSGGCTQYVLDNKGKIVTVFTVSDYPIVIDSKKTKGWKDLIIWSGGKNRLVKFDGKKYPSNPSIQAEFKETPGDGLPRALDFVNEPYPWFRF